ncbi:ras-related protein Rab-21-like isoform X2 [Limulus polyphemus]|uniref:Ras-related protein Rab-21-like isoform X2 n=1 Tax=Limulus polyphemus TaxID=6850 RepID=A0ABM1TE21_LIMPO|nr:ras-related protein Rab-21-like isoform X2 [Limulus polyphemus]
MDSLEAKVVVLGSQDCSMSEAFIISFPWITLVLVKPALWFVTLGRHSVAIFHQQLVHHFSLVNYMGHSWSGALSFNELRRNVEEAVVMCVLGNKCDLKSNRAVNTTEAQQYAVSIGATYFETSAVSNEGIEEAFAQTALGLIEVFKNNESQHNKSNDSLDGVDNVLSPQYPLRTNVIKTSEPEGQRIFCC